MAADFQAPKLTQPVPGGPFREDLVEAVHVSTGPADAGKLVVLNSAGVLDPSMGGGGGSTGFNDITSGVNNSASMQVDTGATITFVNNGVVNANKVAGQQWTNQATSAGQIPIFDGSKWIPGDPFVQGVFPPGTNTSTGFSGGPIQPVLVGGSDYAGTPLLHDLKVDSSGMLYIANFPGSVTVSGTVAVSSVAGNVNVTQGTSPWVISFTAPQHVIVDSATLGTVVITGTDADNAVNSTTKLPTLPARANTSVPSWTDGHEVPLSVDLSGALRVSSSGTFTPALTADRTSTGNITSNQNVAVSCAGGGTVAISVTGTWTGTLVFEATADGTNWVGTDVSPIPFGNLVGSVSSNGQWTAACGGLNQFRVRGNTVATGTAVIWLEVGAGSNAMVIMDIVQGSVSISNFPATQTVSGNVTAAQGSANSVANSWPVEITDGTNVLMTTTHPGNINISQVGGSNVATATTGIMKIGVTDATGTAISSTSDSGTTGLNVHVTNTGGLGGTQYVEGTNIATTPTGTLAMGKNASNLAEALRLDASNNLNVNVNTALPTGTNTLGSIKITDGTNVLGTAAHPVITQDVSDGTPGLAVPATALFVAGKDNATGFLHGLSTDSSGVLNVNAAVSGSFTPALTADRTASGTLTTINGAVTLSTQGVSGVVFNVVNDTTAWSGTLAFEASPDGTNWYPAFCFAKYPSGAAVQNTTVNGQWTLPAGGLNSFRVRANTAITGGTGAKVWIEAGAGPLVVEVAQVTASNLNATVTQGTAANPAGAWPVEITDGTNILGTSAHPVKTDGSAVTQPVQLQAGSANVGFVGYELPTIGRMSQTAINFSTSGDNTLVAGVGGQTIRIWRIIFNVGGSTNITIKDGAVTAFSGPLTFSSSGGMILDFSGEPWYTTSTSNAFVFNSTNAVQVGGTVWYTQS